MARPSTEQKQEAPGWQARLAAAELIHGTLELGADLESAMNKSRAFGKLEGADRGFARAIAGAALRGVGRIGWALGGMVDRPIAEIQPEVRAFLFAGAAQLWLMGVAEHAAVSATVEAAGKWREAAKGGGLVNAVLRRAARERQAFEKAPAISVWPDWLAARFKSALGLEQAEALALLQLEEPATDLTLNAGEDPQAWAARLDGTALPNGSVRLASGGRLEELPGYSDGKWWVQDAAASIAAKLVGDVRGKLVADLCAAPGGKAMQLAAMGARLTAVEISKQRIERLKENAARARLSMHVVEADARQWRPPDLLDAVLLDAPCSALGVLRRHPEGVWRRDPKDLVRFPAIQKKLVEAAGEMLRPGGVLVYCVCTPSPEEGRDVIDWAVRSGDWRRVKITPDEVPGFAGSL
ncbi:MAG TPA: transcription antitermination factor NusB, partial [Hyphomonadaceae bacterium]|nr:transcription antitermination factor NusB [Hyphomonadaceae bacterium]